MAVENKTTIILPDGRAVEVLKPVIVSASRSTDIPAFYPDWFFKRLEIGYSVWTNPFNGIRSYISYEDGSLFSGLKIPARFFHILIDWMSGGSAAISSIRSMTTKRRGMNPMFLRCLNELIPSNAWRNCLVRIVSSGVTIR